MTGGSAKTSFAVRGRLGDAALALAVMFAFARYYQMFPMDDGAFFLRYAEHLASGFGYRWNVGEVAPIGASAPLWPLLQAGLINLGLSARVASLSLAFLGLFVGSTLLSSTMRAVAGWPAAVSVALFVAATAFILGPSMGGLETPLTIALLAASLAVLAASWNRDSARDWCVFSVLAMGLVIQKVDLAPFALGLLLAAGYDFRRKATWPSVAVAALLLGAFFGFMKLGTGDFLPLSLLRKFQDSTGLDGRNLPTMSRYWFVQNVFFDAEPAFLGNGRAAITAMALFALPGWYRGEPRLLTFLAVGIIGQAVAYTVFPPTEPFIWYLSPSLLGMDILAAGAFLTPRPGARFSVPLVAMAALACGAYALARAEPQRSWFVDNSASVEADRAHAGQWVAAHTPGDFRVLTGFGNSAYYSNRWVYDQSRLNTDIDLRLHLPEMVAAFEPEIVIYNPAGSHVSPREYRAAFVNYRLIKVFSSAYEAKSANFYIVVLAREDVADRLKSEALEETNFHAEPSRRLWLTGSR